MMMGCQVDCNYVVSSSHGVFARLEHHKSHEYTTRRAPGVRGGTSLRKRRGRPPKYVGDYEFSEDEIRARAAVDGPSSAIAHGFVRYSATDQCTDRRCVYRYRDHYHCVRARCHDVELQPAALVAHDREFHANFSIAHGFEFYGADVDCRRARCSARRGRTGPTGLRHFHCVRTGCDYAFVRQSTMTQHEAKHRMMDKQTLTTGTLMSSASTASPSRPPVRIVPRQTVSLLSPSVGVPTVLGKALLPAGSTALFTGPSLPTQIMSTTFAGVSSLIIAGLPTAPISVAAGGAVQVTPVSQVGLSVPGAAVRGLVSSALPPSSSSLVVVAGSEVKSELSARVEPAVVVPSRHGAGVDCGRESCRLKHSEHVYCGQCDAALADSQSLSEHVSRVHRETTHHPTTSTAASSPASTSVVHQQPAVCITVQNTALLDSITNSKDAQRHDNDNDNDNSVVHVIDLSDKGRPSSVECGSCSSETDNSKCVDGVIQSD